MHNAMHAARLVQLEGVILSLLREAAEDHDARADGLRVHAYTDKQEGVVMDIEFMRGAFVVAGESL